jgi:ribulose-5-phosphate 4-epimerase/fuculose-1-phosphate aldolase
MSIFDKLLDDLVIANRILANEKVVDALGHVSIRHPDRPDRFFLSCSRSPELVVRDDIMEYDLDCNPIEQRGRPMYFERPIHGAIYKARPDIMSVVHNHAYEVIPFGLTNVKLRPVVNPACGIGHDDVPVWDIRQKFGDTNMLVTNLEQGFDLAACLGKGQVALMRGHGCVIAGLNLREAVLTSIYLKVNAQIQAEAMRLGEVTYLSKGEIEKTSEVVNSENSVNRMWEYWRRRAGMDDSAVTHA